MVYKQTITIDKATFKNIAKKALTGPNEVFDQYANLIVTLGNETVAILSRDPGPSRSPVRWTSKKQKGYVFKFILKKDGQGNIIPYRRTGRYLESWDWELVPTSNRRGGVFDVFNTAKTSKGLLLEQFVQGDRQQGFHADTGFVASERVKKEAGIKAELALVTMWEDVMGEL